MREMRDVYDTAEQQRRELRRVLKLARHVVKDGDDDTIRTLYECVFVQDRMIQPIAKTDGLALAIARMTWPPSMDE